MANVTLGPVRDLWKRISDWVSGATADKPAVTAYGSDDGGATRRALATNASGQLIVAPEAGLATEAQQDLAKEVLDTISIAVAARATEQTLAQIKGALTDGSTKVQLSGSVVELSSAQYSEVATTVKTYARAAGASRLEVYVESGRVRVRTDGESCTAVTGEPFGEGFGAAWAAASISVLYVDDAVITVVSR